MRKNSDKILPRWNSVPDKKKFSHFGGFSSDTDNTIDDQMWHIWSNIVRGGGRLWPFLMAPKKYSDLDSFLANFLGVQLHFPSWRSPRFWSGQMDFNRSIYPTESEPLEEMRAYYDTVFDITSNCQNRLIPDNAMNVLNFIQLDLPEITSAILTYSAKHCFRWKSQQKTSSVRILATSHL